MGILNYQQPIAKNVQMIDAFGGLNKHFRISENEFSDILNMTADDYPVLSTRRPRKYLRYRDDDNVSILPVIPDTTVSVVYVNDIPAVLTSDGYLYYKDKKEKLGCTDNNMFAIGNMLYIYPAGIVVTLPRIADGEIQIEYTEFSAQVNNNSDEILLFQPANLESVDNCSYFDEAKTYETGEYCWRDIDGETTLQRWCGEEIGWKTMVASLIRVSFAVNNGDGTYGISAQSGVFSGLLHQNDVVFVENTGSVHDGTYLVEYVTDKAIYLAGSVSDVSEYHSGNIERRMPEIDYAVAHDGRIWACRYGYSASAGFVNEIYATALNSPMNWYRFQGTSQDSYALSLISDGKFTGATVINGYVTFFKERYMHRIYGTLPESFQLYSIECNGIQEGCEKSLVCCNGIAYYKSPCGVMAISDGLPVLISDNLGTDVFTSSFAGTDGKKYYIAMSAGNDRCIYVYDISKGIWHCEDCPEGFGFFFNYRNNLFMFVKHSLKSIEARIKELEKLISGSNNNILNAIARIQIKALELLLETGEIHTGDIVCISENPRAEMPVYFKDESAEKYTANYEGERNIEWLAVSGDIGYSLYGKKYISQLVFRVFASDNSKADIDIKYNFSDEWENIYSISGENISKSCSVTIKPVRCDSFRLRFRGKGDVKILSVAKIYEEGSEK